MSSEPKKCSDNCPSLFSVPNFTSSDYQVALIHRHVSCVFPTLDWTSSSSQLHCSTIVSKNRSMYRTFKSWMVEKIVLTVVNIDSAFFAASLGQQLKKLWKPFQVLFSVSGNWKCCVMTQKSFALSISPDMISLSDVTLRYLIMTQSVPNYS